MIKESAWKSYPNQNDRGPHTEIRPSIPNQTPIAKIHGAIISKFREGNGINFVKLLQSIPARYLQLSLSRKRVSLNKFKPLLTRYRARTGFIKPLKLAPKCTFHLLWMFTVEDKESESEMVVRLSVYYWEGTRHVIIRLYFLPLMMSSFVSTHIIGISSSFPSCLVGSSCFYVDAFKMRSPSMIAGIFFFVP